MWSVIILCVLVLCTTGQTHYHDQGMCPCFTPFTEKDVMHCLGTTYILTHEPANQQSIITCMGYPTG